MLRHWFWLRLKAASMVRSPRFLIADCGFRIADLQLKSIGFLIRNPKSTFRNQKTQLRSW
jgi:hypothetical protein